MQINRHEDTSGVYLTITFDPRDIGHKVSCPHHDTDFETGATKAPTVQISLTWSMRTMSPNGVLSYANEICAVAGVAAALQIEMRRRYDECAPVGAEEGRG